MSKKELLLSNLSKGVFNCDKVKIMSLIKVRPMTVQNIVSSGWAKQTASARLSELVAMGLIKKSARHNKETLYSFVDDINESLLLSKEMEIKKVLSFFQNSCEKGYLVFNEKNEAWEFNIEKLKFKN